MKRLFARILPVFLAAGALAGCATSPTSGDPIFSIVSAEQENQIGAQQHTQSLKQFGGVSDNTKLNVFVAKIGARLVPYAERKDVKWTFTVLNTDIVNAFASPGGYIYITRGLLALAQDESQVAAVLAHEMGHVNARHSAQQISQGMVANISLQAIGMVTGSDIASQTGGVGADMFLKSYSREHEFEADALSVRYLAKAGYDPYAAEKFLTMLQQYTALSARMEGQKAGGELFSYFNTHPQTADRITRAKALADEANQPPHPTINRAGYLVAINGTVYGDSAEQGFVRGQTFFHPGLRIKFDAPNGFLMKNATTHVIAKNSKGAQMIFDMGQGKDNDPAAYIVTGWATNAALSHQENLTINGLNAATAAAQVSTDQGIKDAQLVAITAGENRFYRLIFLAPEDELKNYSTVFRRATYSFRRLSATEAHGVTPNRIRIITVKPGDTIQSLASAMGVKDFAIERFCLLNGITEHDVLTSGEIVKTVE